ncbi:MAG TPA: hypothetical protein VMJ35_04040 [Dongiaceae bacterium]|nr:hypothetical protein [Dongiaceae bacterium]
MAHAAASLEANLTRATRLAVQIGGASFGMWCVGGMSLTLDPEHEPFLMRSARPNETCDIELEIDWAASLELPAGEPSFVSGGLWSAYASSTGTKFYFSSPALGGQPYKAAWFDPRFERGHVVLNRSAIPVGRPVFPLEYPLDELVMMHRLALGEGVEVHALGLADEDGSGYLFLGHSGAGKSTTARLWLNQPGVQMLSDDRIILREHDSEIWMYGTPWHGDAGIASPGRARLSRIFVLEQAPTEEVIPLNQGQAAAELFARAFVPFYRKSAVQFSLEFLDQVTRSVPCSTFRFTPTASAVEAIRHGRV